MEDQVSILIVDDDRKNIQAVQALLTDPGYELIVAETPDDALRAVLNHDLALVLLDVYLKESNGYDLARTIKSRPKSRHIPIIFLSAMSRDQDTMEKAYAAGAVDFIQKPLDSAALRAKVAVFAELFRKTRKIEQQKRIIDSTEIETAQLAEQKRFQDLVEGVEHGFVWSADPATLAFNYVSPRAELLLGYPVERWQTEPDFWLNHIHPDDRDAARETLRTAKMGKDVGLEHRFISADGETLWFHTGVRLARRGWGAGVELRGLSIDMTYQKMIEQGLSHALQARDEFLSIASHELRTPLTPLLLQLQSLERAISNGTELTSDRLSKTIEIWRRQVDRLARLIDELLDVSKISAGKLTLSLESVDLQGVLDEVAERFKPALTKASCELRIKQSGNTAGHWDKSKLDQVLTNLFSNAVKYAAGTPIEVTLEGSGDSVSLSVRDHGVGISEDDQKRIFERFERATEAKNISGLGLGLYISRKIIEAHGGKIRVESKPGKGSCFTIELPRKEGAEEVA